LKDIIKRTIVLGTLVILMTMSIVPIQASENKKEVSPQTTHENGKNILAYITVEWESFFSTWNITHLPPKINITQSDIRDFYFPEINGVIKMNFTIVCKQKVLDNVLFRRWVRFEFYLPNSSPYIYNTQNSSFTKKLTWEYSNITVGPNTLNDLVTNGSNATLIPRVGVRCFPIFWIFFFGVYEDLKPIVVHPIPTPP
jgi:hypothetical protein